MAKDVAAIVYVCVCVLLVCAGILTTALLPHSTNATEKLPPTANIIVCMCVCQFVACVVCVFVCVVCVHGPRSYVVRIIRDLLDHSYVRECLAEYQSPLLQQLAGE